MQSDDEEMNNLGSFIEGISDRLAEKSKRLSERIRYEAIHSPPQTPFNRYVADRIREARRSWEPTLDSRWWLTASPKEVRDAYMAAAEMAEVDDDASRAATAIRNRYLER